MTSGPTAEGAEAGRGLGMQREPIAVEAVPVLGSDGRAVLGVCTVRKFRRAAGLPFRDITVSDPDGGLVARLTVYRLHSLIRCGELEGDAPAVPSKNAVQVARAGLEAAAGGPAAVLRATVEEAERFGGGPWRESPAD